MFRLKSCYILLSVFMTGIDAHPLMWALWTYSVGMLVIGLEVCMGVREVERVRARDKALFMSFPGC